MTSTPKLDNPRKPTPEELRRVATYLAATVGALERFLADLDSVVAADGDEHDERRQA